MMGNMKALLRSAGFRQSVLVTGSNLLGTSISALSLILVSRSLGPEEFGVFSAGFSLALFLARILDCGFSLALQRQVAQELGGSAHQKTHNGIQSVALFRVGIAVAVGLAGYFFGPIISTRVFHIEDVRVIQIAIGLVGITMGFDFFAYIYQAHQRYLASAVLVMSQALLKLTSAALLVYLNKVTAFTALWFYLVAPAIGIAGGMWGFRHNLLRPPGHTLKDLKLLWQVAKWMSISLLSAAASEHIDVLIIKNQLTSVETGLFSAASRITMFVSLLGLSLATVLSVRAASYKTKEHIDRYRRKANLVAFGSIILTLMVIPFSRLALLVTVGESYMGVSGVLNLLIIATALASATTPYAALFYTFNRPRYYTYAGLVMMLFLLLFDLTFIPFFGIVGAAYARIISRAAVLVFTLLYINRVYRQQYVHG